MIVYLKNDKDNSIIITENIEQIQVKEGIVHYKLSGEKKWDEMNLHEESGKVKVFNDEGNEVETITIKNSLGIEDL